MRKARMVTTPLGQCGVCVALAIGTGAAAWVDPPSTKETQGDMPQASSGGPVTIRLGPQSSASAQSPVPNSGIEVAQWRFSDRLESLSAQRGQPNFVTGRPIYLSMTLDGTQAAIDDMRADRGLTIQVHWVRDPTETGRGAPNLVTELTIGRPNLADTLEQQVRRNGFFEWHSWARKDTLSPGTWTVSLTYPDGKAPGLWTERATLPTSDQGWLTQTTPCSRGSPAPVGGSSRQASQSCASASR